MPLATVPSATENFDLKSCPEGFVILRRMNYGEKHRRQEIAFDMSIKQDRRGKAGKSRGKAGKSRGKNAPTVTDIKNMQRAVIEYEFATCIVDHNLENEIGKMDFSIPKHVHSLNPEIGDEISDLIMDFNGFDDNDDEEDDYEDLE